MVYFWTWISINFPFFVSVCSVLAVPIALIPATLFLLSTLFLLLIVSGTVMYRRRIAEAKKGRPYLRMET